LGEYGEYNEALGNFVMGGISGEEEKNGGRPPPDSPEGFGGWVMRDEIESDMVCDHEEDTPNFKEVPGVQGVFCGRVYFLSGCRG